MCIRDRCEEEAIRVIKLTSGNWSPAFYNGNAIPTRGFLKSSEVKPTPLNIDLDAD